MQAALAQTYLQLRVQDAQIELLRSNVDAFQRSLTLTQNQYAAGIVARPPAGRVDAADVLDARAGPNGDRAVGPLAGGALTQWGSWEWVFLVNVPLGLIVFVAAILTVPESRGAKVAIAAIEPDTPKSPARLPAKPAPR